ncbi:Cuticle protein, partial [Frankliniella fusca]
MLSAQVAALLLLVAVAGRSAQGRAVVREDVKGVASLLRDEARGDPFFDDNPQYDFAYRIHDEETGDAKDQSEERRGDAVHGSYSVVDPDGTLRVVRYTADDANGFNAVVSLTPGHAKPFVPKPVVQRRVAVVQNHVDVPVPVQHHLLPSTSQQTLGDRRVLVEHPKHQAGALVQQHLIQPPLAFGLHQDVHHLIPHGPAYQLHQIHQVKK